jgi:hypothetical protein
MALHAVLTGDIVNSTKLSVAKEARLMGSLKELFANRECKIEFYRGDSFQGYVKNPANALRMALMCRTTAIKLHKTEKEIISDVRISIGIGEVQLPLRSIKTAKGEAFVISGRNLDEISKQQQRLTIASTNPLANTGLGVIANYLDAIFDTMTGKQAEVIFELLKGEMQKTVAKKIKKTKSTIHQRTTAGRWPEIDRLLQQYESIINQIL